MKLASLQPNLDRVASAVEALPAEHRENVDELRRDVERDLHTAFKGREGAGTAAERSIRVADYTFDIAVVQGTVDEYCQRHKVTDQVVRYKIAEFAAAVAELKLFLEGSNAAEDAAVGDIYPDIPHEFIADVEPIPISGEQDFAGIEERLGVLNGTGIKNGADVAELKILYASILELLRMEDDEGVVISGLTVQREHTALQLCKKLYATRPAAECAYEDGLIRIRSEADFTAFEKRLAGVDRIEDETVRKTEADLLHESLIAYLARVEAGERDCVVVEYQRFARAMHNLPSFGALGGARLMVKSPLET